MKKVLFIVFTLLSSFATYGQEHNLCGPYEIVARNGEYRHTKGGSERDMRAAYDLAVAGDEAAPVAIINAYAQTLQGFDGHDAPLCTIQAYDLVRAMTLMKGHRTAEWDAMVRRAILPTIAKFDADSPYANGNYLIHHRYTDTYLTSPGEKEAIATLAPLTAESGAEEADLSQVWYLEQQSGRYSFINLKDSLHLNKEGVMKSRATRSFRFKGAAGTSYLSIQNTSTSGKICWTVTDDGSINYAGSESPIDYPFELIPYKGNSQGISNTTSTSTHVEYYTLSGLRIEYPTPGIYIRRTIHADGKVEVKKVFYK